ncbi:MAG: Ribosomal protein S8E [Candidatus Parvarchaeum acidiphilum ARMAN-4]|jgi:small subunit ribosomal protein S8e|uniref:Ribosomal protein S8E n=1 Tax=Candidatus Parvarchaeum acidiphilum ARMAN-4 TaxID=662760 RepID=D2EGR9_PARA4|nr:MAG: Ribosomal protein S8E [Candidatus Parvarchaeum acidiphilum ARMAN-4]
MSKSTAPSLKKKGGGFKGKRRDKRRSESKNLSVPLQVGERKIKTVRTVGGNIKITPLKTDQGNLFDPKNKKTSKVKIVRVLENKANRSYARRNIITKGALIETDQGKAVVTNRPGQDGQVTLKKVD